MHQNIGPHLISPPTSAVIDQSIYQTITACECCQTRWYTIVVSLGTLVFDGLCILKNHSSVTFIIFVAWEGRGGEGGGKVQGKQQQTEREEECNDDRGLEVTAKATTNQTGALEGAQWDGEGGQTKLKR